MTKQDTYKAMAMLQAIYPDAFRAMSEESAKLKVELWHDQFKDEPAALVTEAIKAFISSDVRGFMPVPGQIKEQLSRIRNHDGLSEQDAWDLVLNALRNSSYSSVGEYAKLPEDIQRAVGSPNMLKDWAIIPFDQLQTVVASNFKREYRSIVAEKREFEKLPNSVKQLSENAASRLPDSLPHNDLEGQK